MHAGSLTRESEDRLTAWMVEHLRLVVHPVADAGALRDMESQVLAALDPPLNLECMRARHAGEDDHFSLIGPGTVRWMPRRDEIQGASAATP